MRNPTQTILTVARNHRRLRVGYLSHYGRKLGGQLYRQARRQAAAFLRDLPHERRRAEYFRHDSIMLAAPGDF